MVPTGNIDDPPTDTDPPDGPTGNIDDPPTDTDPPDGPTGNIDDPDGPTGNTGVRGGVQRVIHQEHRRAPLNLLSGQI